MRNKKDIQLLEALEAAAALHEFELVDIERTGSGKNSLLRVFIDKPEGLTLDDVAAANAWVAETVETLDPYKSSYTLEVSSPGIDRPLRTFAHFEKALGKEAVITLASAESSLESESIGAKPRRNYTGVITAVDPATRCITLEAEGLTHELEFLRIKKARIKGCLDFEGRKDS